MLTFTIDNDFSYFNNLINDLNTAMKYTAKKQNYDFSKAIIKCLKQIIINKDTRCFTRDYGMRFAMNDRYTSDNYFNIICSTLKVKNPNMFYSLIREHNGKYYCTEDTVNYMIEYYCNNDLLPIINEWGINLDLFKDYQNTEIVQPQVISYFQPSDECKKAILNNTQTALNESSFVCSGLFAYSNVGKKRHNQEDSYYIGVHPNNPLFKIMIVADGMGGHEFGEVASNIAVKEIMLWFEQLDASEFYNQENYTLYQKLQDIIDRTNQEIKEKARNGGTTLCLAIIKNDSIFMGNIGDSQGFIMENNNLVGYTIPQNVPTYNKIPNQVARYHRENNRILAYLGGSQSPKVTATQFNLKPNCSYKVLLCSDGVTDCVRIQDIMNIMRKNNNNAQTLVEAALINESKFEYDFNLLSKEDQQTVQRNLHNFYNNIPAGKDNATATVAEFETNYQAKIK